MNRLVPITVLCAFGTLVAAHSETTSAYDVEREMTALMQYAVLSYTWKNEAMGAMAETRSFSNDGWSCTFYVRQTETFHQRCIFDEQQRVNYATDPESPLYKAPEE